MGMPQIPEGTHRPNCTEVIIDLLESIALDHMSLAHLMNAEGEKLQETINKYACDELDYCEVECSFQSANKLLNNVIMQQWLLFNRLNTVLEVQDQIKDMCPPPPCPPPCSPPCFPEKHINHDNNC